LYGPAAGPAPAAGRPRAPSPLLPGGAPAGTQAGRAAAHGVLKWLLTSHTAVEVCLESVLAALSLKPP
jgi:hypothetical protein